MRVLYHHRTRGTDAQRVHIREMVNAFRESGHAVRMVEVASTETRDAVREATEASWKTSVRHIPFAYDAVQLAYNLLGLPMLIWRILADRIDFVYERYSLYCFCGVLAARFTRRPIVLEVNSPFALEQGRDGDIRARRLAAWMERAIWRGATKVVVVSGPLRRILETSGVDRGNIALLPNGINVRHLSTGTGTDALRRRHGLMRDQIVIGFVGWFKKWHGLEFLIETFAESGLRSRGAVLMLVGNGPAGESLRALVDARSLGDCVLFTGPVPHEEIPIYLNMMDVAVQPAANEYCCPMKIIEYMGVAKPVIAPRQENICELLPEDSALLFEPGDTAGLARALETAVKDPLLRQQLGARAKQVVFSRGLLWVRNAEAVVRMISPADVAAQTLRANQC